MKIPNRLPKWIVLLLIITLIVPSVSFVYGDTIVKNDYQTISVGEYHSAAIKSDGSLWMWGNNEEGQLGDGTLENKMTPVKTMDEVIAISTGSYHSAVIKKDKSLWIWGANLSHQLGEGTTVTYTSPIKVLDNVLSVSLGSLNTGAIKSDGSLWVWGWNADGQLTGDTSYDREIPSKILDNVLSVSLGYNHSFAIKTDGSLWGWGYNNYGKVGSGTEMNMKTPVKILDNVVMSSTGGNHSSALMSDGSLWTWGNNDFGQLGDGTRLSKSSPEKIMEGVVSVSLGQNHSSAIKSDGSLWMWGDNQFGQLGDGTSIAKSTPIKIMENVKFSSLNSRTSSAVKSDGSLWLWGDNKFGQLGNGTLKNSNIPINILNDILVQNSYQTNQSYLYDILDLGAAIMLPMDKLKTITNQSTAISVVKLAISTLTDAEKLSQTGIDLITLFAEEAVALSGNQSIEGGKVTLNQNILSASALISLTTQKDAENLLNSSGITTARTIDTAITMHTTDEKKTELSVEASSALIGVDELRVSSPTHSIAVPTTLVQSMGQGGFGVTVTVLKPGEVVMNQPELLAMTDNGKKAMRNATTVEAGTKYVVAIDKPLTDNIKISLPPLTGDPTFQAVIKSDGTAVGGKYNPATGMIDVRIKTSDTYMIKNNLKDFSDIQNKSVEMQNAIKVLASKGIIGGTSPTTFSPDSSITRVEIAALILRTLSKLDPKANGSFNDVKSSDWYYGVAGSAKQYGIMNGLSAGIFAPKNTILKEQIIAVAARTLKNEMKYKDPVSVESILSVYKDKSGIPSWGIKEIALATKENLVVKRTDSNFAPKGSMSRGDAAVILYRLFSKIW